MKLTDDEKDLLNKVLSLYKIESNREKTLLDSISKKLASKQLRKKSKFGYSTSKAKQNDNFKKIYELLRSNINMTNTEIMEKTRISKATFYKIYAEKARKWREENKKESLF